MWRCRQAVSDHISEGRTAQLSRTALALRHTAVVIHWQGPGFPVWVWAGHRLVCLVEVGVNSQSGVQARRRF